LGLPPDADPEEQRLAEARERMVTQQLISRGINDARVLEAMRTVPRHRFVSPDLRFAAYTDNPLSIGLGQTISQPFIVALMTQLLAPQPADRVLEIGVGSGYQTAVLSGLVKEVIGIERVPELAREAGERLRALGYTNVKVIVGDGTEGYPPCAPYDGILAAAAAPTIPEPLLQQLADGGRLVLPVGSVDEQLIELVRRRGGSFHIERLTPVRFVPLIGKYGFKRGW